MVPTDQSVPVANARGSACGEAALCYRFALCARIPAWYWGGDVVLEAHWRALGENAPAAFTEHQLIALLQLLKELRTKRDVACGAASLGGFSESRAMPLPADALV